MASGQLELAKASLVSVLHPVLETCRADSITDRVRFKC